MGLGIGEHCIICKDQLCYDTNWEETPMGKVCCPCCSMIKHLVEFVKERGLDD